MNYKKFKLELYIEQDQNINLQINLGLGTELDVYQVNSKTELNREKLLEIKECIRSNRKNFYKACSQKKA